MRTETAILSAIAIAILFIAAIGIKTGLITTPPKSNLPNYTFWLSIAIAVLTGLYFSLRST